MGIRAHSTRSVVASKAFLTGVPIQDICNTASWSMPLTFVRFYSLDMRATPGSSVLSPSSCSWGIHTGQGLGSLATWASHSPKRLTGCSSSSWWGMPQATYVTLTPRRNEMLHLGATLPASPPAFFYSLKLMPAASHMLLYQLVISLPRPWRLARHWTDYTWYSEPLTLETFPKASYRMQHLVPLRNQGYICNLRRFYNLLNSIQDYLYSAFLRYNLCKAALH